MRTILDFRWIQDSPADSLKGRGGYRSDFDTDEVAQRSRPKLASGAAIPASGSCLSQCIAMVSLADQRFLTTPAQARAHESGFDNAYVKGSCSSGLRPPSGGRQQGLQRRNDRLAVPANVPSSTNGRTARSTAQAKERTKST